LRVRGYLKVIRREIHYFLAAVMFFTRIPCPSWVDHNEEILNKSRKYFPLMGWIVGGVTGLTYYIFAIIFPVSISILISMIVGVLLTGAFHEDGFTDVCDSFGGGWGKENILKIMKDSRIGAYGVIGICLLVFLKYSVLVELSNFGNNLVLISLINGHVSSRFIASTFVQSHEYVQDLDISKSKPIANSKLSIYEMSYSFLFTILPYFLFPSVLFLSIFVPAFLSKVYLGYYFHKHIGGYTGDCLGATQQVSEVVLYISILGIWKYI